MNRQEFLRNKNEEVYSPAVKAVLAHSLIEAAEEAYFYKKSRKYGDQKCHHHSGMLLLHRFMEEAITKAVDLGQLPFEVITIQKEPRPCTLFRCGNVIIYIKKTKRMAICPRDSGLANDAILCNQKTLWPTVKDFGDIELLNSVITYGVSPSFVPQYLTVGFPGDIKNEGWILQENISDFLTAPRTEVMLSPVSVTPLSPVLKQNRKGRSEQTA